MVLDNHPLWELIRNIFPYLKEAHIPYSRLHDVGGCFGGNMFVDIPNVFKFCINDAVCLDKKYDSPTVYKTGNCEDFVYASLENSVQNTLSQSGDDMRISWGVFYLATKNQKVAFSCITEKNEEGKESNTIQLQVPFCFEQTVALAYDDIKSLKYFGKHLDGYWKRYYTGIFEAIADALNEYDDLIMRCDNRSKWEIERADKLGGEKYAELVTLAFRQHWRLIKLQWQITKNFCLFQRNIFQTVMRQRLTLHIRPVR